MNLRQAKTNELALLLHGLRTVYVTDEEPTRQKLMLQLEGELAARGCALGGDSQVVEEKRPVGRPRTVIPVEARQGDTHSRHF